MKTALFLFMLGFCCKSFADLELNIYRGKVVKMISIKGFLVSENCKKNDCLALLQKKKTIPQELLMPLNDGQRIQSKKCTILNGKILIGTLPNRDEMSVCMFQDGSLIDTGQL